MFFNREKRIKYLGFNDFWFAAVGILFLSFVTDFLFNNSFFRFPFSEAVIIWSVSLFFTICDWLIIRTVIILLRKKYPNISDIGKRLVLLFLTIVGTVLIVDFIGNRILSIIFEDLNVQSSPQVLLPIIIISTMTMAIYEAIYYYIRLKKSIREEEQAKQAVVQAELDALKNQAQPHFLFNTLNTLRDIIDQNPKEDAKEFVDKLSDVYRFILESGSVNLTSLKDELKFAKSYIHIQSERFGQNLKMKWIIPNTSLDSMIVPMSLQLLLENAIKHNVISKAKPLRILVEVENNYLVVSNKIQSKSTQIPSTKVGLRNIEKRYHLIAGKSIEIRNEKNQFRVSLPLLKLSDQKNYHGDTHN
ncbi:sensor histidine kinase [Croceitalea rosinachiae]|uniref:Histidine kinase n=1 Tax=Croceitalea rosinachiae TaxID=3075596 RepID=A0ABU3A6U8_9FLAO|nr:histidine kinase [Croceitalea sp. F388]MDT0605903.1 histidine kinase [Croceitalea sp. F388]